MSIATDPASAYDALAPAYDLFTHDYEHALWLENLEVLAVEYGLKGRRVLDVACGTGKSCVPLSGRGYEITACDLSRQMLLRAAEKLPTARFFQADMRELPRVGRFDLVTCLDDALNYLVSLEDLTAALAGMRDNLEADGVALWDLNTLAMYRSAFTRTWLVERDGYFLVWEGRADAAMKPGGIAEATVHVFGSAGARMWHRDRSVHTQRHWTVSEIKGAAGRAGLRIVAIRGQRPGAVLERELDELVHTKAVFVARRDSTRARRWSP